MVALNRLAEAFHPQLSIKTLATAVVDYSGRRLIAQSLVPGILNVSVLCSCASTRRLTSVLHGIWLYIAAFFVLGVKPWQLRWFSGFGWARSMCSAFVVPVSLYLISHPCCGSEYSTTKHLKVFVSHTMWHQFISCQFTAINSPVSRQCCIVPHALVSSTAAIQSHAMEHCLVPFLYHLPFSSISSCKIVSLVHRTIYLRLALPCPFVDGLNRVIRPTKSCTVPWNTVNPSAITRKCQPSSRRLDNGS